MPITDHYERLLLDRINPNRENRQRKDPKANPKRWDELLSSIKQYGVLTPIVVERELDSTGQHKLTMGERRLEASRSLNLPDIPVRFADELTPIEAEIFELEENVKRDDLPWQDRVRATARIHTLHLDKEPGWSQENTCEVLGLTKGTVSIYLTVFEHIGEEKIYNSGTVRTAYNIIRSRNAREEAAIVDSLVRPKPPRPAPIPAPAPASITNGDIIAPVIAPPPALPVHDYRALQNPAKNILLESFLHWAPKYNGDPFNFIHCDFPYGVNVFAGPQAGGDRHHEYADDPELHFKLLHTLLVNFDKIASRSCHVIYWFSMQHYNKILSMVNELVPELLIHHHPLIWIKSDGSGIAADSHHLPRHIYETALFMSRNKRHLTQLVNDAYSAPTDKLWHVHTKPEPVLKYFFSMLVDKHTNFLDPTCGGGSSIRAAESLGARWVLGMDIDEATVGNARMALRHARAKAGAATVDI